MVLRSQWNHSIYWISSSLVFLMIFNLDLTSSGFFDSLFFFLDLLMKKIGIQLHEKGILHSSFLGTLIRTMAIHARLSIKIHFLVIKIKNLLIEKKIALTIIKMIAYNSYRFYCLRPPFIGW
ncbi:expressed protein [Phakopsora pachyrhizi]|uniref:Expressed protein n=1 Tax=Phakopsora pachyrhizi TaxID=170000 RepID=A0AAV0ALK7_PHAPC|nr:expressed protein [Phakopsora pachyrhizi]